MRARVMAERKAFSMLTAIIVIVIMASIGAFVMSLSAKMTKSTTAQYQREQAMLLAKSYTEFAIMAVMSNDVTTHCLDSVTGTALGNYAITTQISYIGNNTRIPASCTNILSNAVLTPGSPINIIIDVYVSYNEPDNPSGARLTYHKRTLQKL